MSELKKLISGFFGIAFETQSYINMLYLLASFPLGVFYFIFLVAGLSAGVSLSIIWIGIPILVFVFVGWIAFAKFERLIIINILKEDIPVAEQEIKRSVGLYKYFLNVLSQPFSWKSLLFLLLKFPFGIVSFGILITFISLSVILISLPFSYNHMQFFNISVPFLFGGQMINIANLKMALAGSLLGLILWPTTLFIARGLAWMHANSAKLLLGEPS